jgi:hypothetical protein
MQTRKEAVCYQTTNENQTEGGFLGCPKPSDSRSYITKISSVDCLNYSIFDTQQTCDPMDVKNKRKLRMKLRRSSVTWCPVISYVITYTLENTLLTQRECDENVFGDLEN